MATAVKFDEEAGGKVVSLADIVLFLFDRLPKKEREKFLREVPESALGEPE